MQWGVTQLQTNWNWCSWLARIYPPALNDAQNGERKGHEITMKRLFASHQKPYFSEIQTITYDIFGLLSTFTPWIGPEQILDRLYSKMIFIKGAWHSSLCCEPAVVEYNLPELLQCIKPQDRGDLSPIHTLASRAEQLRTVLEWQIDSASCELQGCLHMDTPFLYISRLFFFLLTLSAGAAN